MGKKVFSWIGVKSSYPMPVRASRISGFKSKSENFILNPQITESILNRAVLFPFFPKPTISTISNDKRISNAEISWRNL
jgi:hypothetical protein